MRVASITIPPENPIGLDSLEDVIALAREKHGYKETAVQPTVGSTGYLDVWNHTYENNTFGSDEYGRKFIITSGGICIFQRYSGDGRILVSTSRRGVKDPFPSALEVRDLQKVLKIIKREGVYPEETCMV